MQLNEVIAGKERMQNLYENEPNAEVEKVLLTSNLRNVTDFRWSVFKIYCSIIGYIIPLHFVIPS